MKINLIVAMCMNNGIGINNTLPWTIPEDMKHFMNTTKGNGNNAIIMGSNTWKSIGRPLKDRKNVVISRTLKETINNVYFFSSIEKGIQDCIECDEIWLIGGRQIYEYCLNNINIDSLVVTYIDKDIECDCYFPNFEMDWKITTKRELCDKVFVLNYCPK
tara:strand:- start:68 stop:547 length:480 start_codon:yes stop_codon:yes gene_type:complete